MSTVGPRRARLAGRLSIAALLAALLLPGGAGAAPAVGPKQHGPLAPDLVRLAQPSFRQKSLERQARILGVAAAGPGSLIRQGGRVLVEVRFESGALARVRALRRDGVGIVAASHRYQTVTARVPFEQLGSVAELPGLRAITPVRAPVLRASPGACEGGLVISEGVQQLNVEKARDELGFEGEGVTVGVLSDSLNQANEAVPGGPIATKEPEDILSKDLPGPTNSCPGQEVAVNDIKDYLQKPGEEDPFDEGRAMLQTVHDVAPLASLGFSSAFNGELAFAEGIEALARPSSEGGAGAKVIVDDVGYFGEPFFQDGPVAAAINQVTAKGVTYLTAAGNDNLFDGEGNEIASWEAPAYRSSGSCPGAVRELGPEFEPSNCLDFNPEPPVDRTFGIEVESGETLSVDLQWAEPWFGVGTDLDAFLLNAKGELLTGSTDDNVDEEIQQPVEIVQWTNEGSADAVVQLVVNRFDGGNPRLKFILLQNGGGVSGTEYPRSGGGDVVGPSVYGHAGSASAVAAAAVVAPDVPDKVAGVLEPYSSRGPATHYFGPVESDLPAPPIPADVISKPDVAATDCGQTTFFAREVEPKTRPGIWRFCGTSAAAPHAAGVAALMAEAEPAATPAAIRASLVGTGAPVGTFGPCAVGGGRVDAVAALEAVTEPAPPAPPAPCFPPDASGPVTLAPGDWGSEEPPAPPAPPTNPAPPAPQPAPVPPTTRFAKHPPKVLRTRSNTVRLVFGFGSDQAGVRFLCKFDATAFRACGAQLAHRFGLGIHVVRVKAQTAAGLVDPTPAVFRFQVRRVA
jgi:subtilisin family serine protease